MAWPRRVEVGCDGRAGVGDATPVAQGHDPTGALDTLTGDKVMELLRTIAEGGAAVVVVTHEPRVASFADRVVTLRDGRRVADTGAAVAPDLDPPRPRHPIGAGA